MAEKTLAALISPDFLHLLDLLKCGAITRMLPSLSHVVAGPFFMLPYSASYVPTIFVADCFLAVS